MAAATTLPVHGANRGDRLPAALLTDGFGNGAHAHDAAPDLKVAGHTIRPRDESLDTTRAFVHRTLRAWRVDTLADDVALVVIELVTNALRHGVRARGSAASVDVSLYGTASRLMCVVSDPSDEVPVRLTPDLSHGSGRGLQIVEALSMYWGWTARERDDGTPGKSVWAVFALDGVGREQKKAG